MKLMHVWRAIFANTVWPNHSKLLRGGWGVNFVVLINFIDLLLFFFITPSRLRVRQFMANRFLPCGLGACPFIPSLKSDKPEK